MDKKVVILISLIIVIVLGLAVFVAIRDKKNEPNADAIKFKEEYESLNDTKTEAGNTLPTVSIDEDNIYRYKTEAEIYEIITNGTGIIYFGFPGCPWCRNAIPVLSKVMESYGIKEVSYLNILDIRDIYELNDKNKPVLKRESTEGYKKLLEALDSVLDDYTLTYEVKGVKKSVKVGEKRILAPTVVFVKAGKIVGINIATVESQKNAYVPLTTAQEEELYKIYEEKTLLVYDDLCDEAC